MNILVTADKNWAIGNQGQLLVSIPEDQRLLREETLWLCRQFGLFPFTVYLVYSFPQGTFFITGEVEAVIVGIPA